MIQPILSYSTVFSKNLNHPWLSSNGIKQATTRLRSGAGVEKAVVIANHVSVTATLADYR